MTLAPSGEKRGPPPKSLSWRTWAPFAAAVKTVSLPLYFPSRMNTILPWRFGARDAEASGLPELQPTTRTMRTIETIKATITASLLCTTSSLFLACSLRETNRPRSAHTLGQGMADCPYPRPDHSYRLLTSARTLSLVAQSP